MKTTIIWHRNDLRVHDLPMLAAAHDQSEQIVPVFIFDKKITRSKHASGNRNRFLYECLAELRQSYRDKGAELYIREGDPATELATLAKQVNADQIFYTIDYTPFARLRDHAVKQLLDKKNISFEGFPGRLAIDSVEPIKTQNGKVVRVFTPFWKQWQQQARRDVATTPQKIIAPATLVSGGLPNLKSLTKDLVLSDNTAKGGEQAGRQTLQTFLDKNIDKYGDHQNSMADDRTSRLSPYLHFGCLSVREIETLLPSGKGAEAFHRQLAWRDFYHYILLQYPDNIDTELQDRYRSFGWEHNPTLLEAWKKGHTGYPIVDASMRQLNQEGWMHNRGRLIVGSFLTKDLLLDWRDGQAYFMQMLLDGDTANNNGNWQWIASVGVDPAPVFRRLYNPSSQQVTYDPTGAFVKKYVPELKDVSDKYLAEPWTMPEEEQQKAHCVVGVDYPNPIVNHKEQRLKALDKYRATKVA
jgi:deoxyribodipyrimidine photo-lyase